MRDEPVREKARPGAEALGILVVVEDAVDSSGVHTKYLPASPSLSASVAE